MTLSYCPALLLHTEKVRDELLCAAHPANRWVRGLMISSTSPTFAEVLDELKRDPGVATALVEALTTIADAVEVGCRRPAGWRSEAVGEPDSVPNAASAEADGPRLTPECRVTARVQFPTEAAAKAFELAVTTRCVLVAASCGECLPPVLGTCNCRWCCLCNGS